MFIAGKCDNYKWKVCRDLKLEGMLLGRYTMREDSDTQKYHVSMFCLCRIGLGKLYKPG